MANSTCPICHCNTKPDPNEHIHDHCELCGIGISALNSSTPSYERNDKAVYFCCERCQSIFIQEIINNNECIDILGKQRYLEILEGYDDLVKDLLIEFINLKYPKNDEMR